MIRTLVLTKIYPARASYYDDWRDAFESSKLYHCDIFNILKPGAAWSLAKIVRDYDLIVLLHSCTADSVYAVNNLAPVLCGRRGKLACFVGNEGNSADYPMGSKIAFLRRVAIDITATGLLPEAGEWLYEQCGQVVSIPHALNPRAFHANLPQRRRPIDIGVRNFKYLPHMGDQERNRIIEFFARHSFSPPLRLDINHEGRFAREGWNGFLNRCRATVSSEANTWYLERDDATALAIRRYAQQKTKSMVLSSDSLARHLVSRLPYGVKMQLLKLLSHSPVTTGAAMDESLDWDEVNERFFAGRPPCPVYSKCTSSRHFDAVGSKTVQIMFPGRFNDILRADEHYIALAPDFSNIDDVMERFRDIGYSQAMVNHTYDYILSEHTHAHRLEALRRLL